MTQICTNEDQSIELINAGLDDKTATMGIFSETETAISQKDGQEDFEYSKKEKQTIIVIPENWDGEFGDILPAWDLATLIGIMPDMIVTYSKNSYDCNELVICQDRISYVMDEYGDEFTHVCFKGGLYETAVSMVKWLIENKHLKIE